MERKVWLDNIRWITVLLVLVYHVFYMFNASGVLGGVGGFAKVQYQDAVLYVLYPWFMLLLFVVAGMSSRYALNKLSHKQFIHSRTLKLLVPSTIGLLVYQWMVGYFNLKLGGVLDTIPVPARYPLMVATGVGPLWFIQDLWLFSLLLVVVRRIDKKDSFYKLCSKTNMLVVALLFFIFWGLSQIYVDVIANPAGGIINIYRFFFYLAGYLIGYYIFSQDEVLTKLERFRWPLLALAVASAIAYTIFYFGQNYSAPEHLALPWTNAYAWVAILAILSCGKHWLNTSTPFTSYISRSSFGIYVVHYLVLVATASTLTSHTSLSPFPIYLICFFAVMLLSPALYELLRRIPFIRWCVLGIKKSREAHAGKK